MRKLLTIILLLLACSSLTACGWDRVEPGYVGVKVHKMGGDRGVDNEIAEVGWHWVGWNTTIYEYPTFTQQHVWTWTDKKNEEILFSTEEGMTVSMDVGIAYSVDPGKVPVLFQKFRSEIADITSKYLRNTVRDAFVNAASTKPVSFVYGKGKADLIREVESIVRRQTDPIGIKVERIYLVGEPRLPRQVVAALNAAIEATQKAQQRENEVRTAEAEAIIVKTRAEGDAAAVRAAAQAEADGTLLKAKAQAEANTLLAKSLTKELVEYNKVQQWDGALPQFMTGKEPNLLISPGN